MRLLLAILGLAIGALCAALVPDRALFLAPSAPVGESTGERWACAMMDYIGSHPGTCPVCGMTLERVEAGALSREQRARMGLRTVAVVEGPAVATVRAWGRAEYDDRFTGVVIPRVAGRIVARHAATWGCCTDVAAGDPIIDLYSPEAFTAQGELAAALRLGDAALVASIEARFVRWNLAQVAADIRSGKAPVDTITIRSPVAGQVLQADADMVNQSLMVGQEVKPDQPLLRLIDAGAMAVVLQVPESRAGFLRVGQKARLWADDGAGRPPVESELVRVGNEVDAGNRTIEARLWLADGRRHFRHGGLVRAEIRSVLGPDLRPADPGDERAWGRFAQVPRTAVLSTGVRHVAWKLTGSDEQGRQRFAPVSLALGPRLEDADGNDRWVVRAGLNPGDQIVERGAFLVDAQAQLAGGESLISPGGL